MRKVWELWKPSGFGDKISFIVNKNDKLDELEMLYGVCHDLEALYVFTLDELAEKLYKLRQHDTMYTSLAHKVDAAKELLADASNELAERRRFLVSLNMVSVP